MTFWCILLIVLFFSCVSSQDFLSKFNQHDFKVKNLRMEVVNYNKEFINNLEISTFKYNRTVAALNATINFKFNIKDKLELLVQVYKFTSNGYRPFAIRFQVNFQKAFDANVFGIKKVTKCGNVQNFYFLKDINYFVCNFVFDDSKLPPLIPPGEYKIELQGLYQDYVIVRANIFLELYIPIKYPGQEKA